MEDEIVQRIGRAIAEKIFPGCVVGIVQKNGKRIILPFGRFTYDEASNVVKEDTIYDVASITKAIPTASLLLTLIDEGRVGLNDSLINYLPEFGSTGGKDKVLISHLLTYTLDLDMPAMSSLKDKTADEIISIAFKAPLKNQPGKKHHYTNVTAGLMGLTIRQLTGRNLDDLSEELFFRPLSMTRTTFHPENFAKNEIVPTEFDDWRGRLIHGEVHDESSYVVNQKFILGMAGLFSTAPDLLKFLEMLLQHGELNGNRYFSASMVRAMHANQLADIGRSGGLGWELNQSEFMGKYAPELFGKTGFTGCLVLASPVKGAGLVILSNRIYPKRGDYQAIYEVRKDIADIVFRGNG